MNLKSHLLFSRKRNVEESYEEENSDADSLLSQEKKQIQTSEIDSVCEIEPIIKEEYLSEAKEKLYRSQ